MPRPLKILIDIDSTLYDAGPLLAECFSHVFGMHEVPMHAWDFWTDQIERETFDAMIDEHFHAPAAIARQTPYLGAREAIERWREAGHEIHVVSDRGIGAYDASADWLRAHQIHFDQLVCERHIDKVAYVEREGIDLVIDDRPETLEGIAQIGVPAATISYPYNARVRSLHPGIVGELDWTRLAEGVNRLIEELAIRAQNRQAEEPA
jgi:uncharacterized HAD superfamily protein